MSLSVSYSTFWNLMIFRLLPSLISFILICFERGTLNLGVVDCVVLVLVTYMTKSAMRLKARSFSEIFLRHFFLNWNLIMPHSHMLQSQRVAQNPLKVLESYQD
jgi:hypothetical protein